MRIGTTLLLGALLWPSTTSWAHGSVYTPPTGPAAPMPKSGIPNPATPPSYGGSPISQPNTPGPGTPGTPGVGPLTGFGVFGVDRTRWTWWWEFHRAPYLDLRRAVLAEDPASGGGEFLGQGSTSNPLRLPTPARIRAEVLPVLYEVLSEETQPDLVSSALVALARVADDLEDTDRRDAADRIRPYLRDGNRELAEAATLALGILGHEPSAPLLAGLARDDAYARSLIGSDRVSARQRAIAAYALGLLAGESEREDVRRYAVHELAELIREERGSAQDDFESACILAFGLIPLDLEAQAPAEDQAPLPASGRRSQVAFLEEILLERRRSDFVRAQLPLSIARLAAGAESEQGEAMNTLRQDGARLLLGRLAPMRREPSGVVASSVIGLGILLDADDDALDVAGRRALRQIDAEHRDRGARRYARIALARIGGRAVSDEDEGLKEVRRFLLSELARGRSEERTWAALSLGVLERARLEAGSIPNSAVSGALRSALADAAAPDEIGSAAVGLGLMREIQAEPGLLAKLKDFQDDEARGFLALSLGMIGARTSRGELHRLLQVSVFRPLILRETATGLALLGDPNTLESLLGQLRESRALASQAALAEAIGRIGDARAFAELGAMIADPGVPATARAFSVVALGLCADLDPLPWGVPLAVHGNHLSAPLTLYDDFGLGVLNLL